MDRSILAMGVSEAAAFGAAILAGVGTGLYDSPEVASSQLAQVQDTYHPDPDLAAQYKLRLDAYQAIHPLVREAYHRLSSIQSTH